MAAPTKIKSNDAGAPTLSGTAGTLVAVLDFCLVTTLGWTKSFSATSKGVYRAPSGVRHYLDIDDTGTTTALWRGYETMSAVGTGTGPFPTTTQVASPTASKSGTADGTGRPWLFFGDDRTFYLFVGSSSTSFPPSNGWVNLITFGEFVSVLTGDNYRTLLNRACTTAAAADSGSTALMGFGPRTYTGLSAAAVHLMNTMQGPLSQSSASSTAPFVGIVPFPNPADGGLYLSKILLAEKGTAATPPATLTTVRGRHRGLYEILHPAASFTESDTFDGQGEYAGRSFYIAKFGATAIVAVETTAWDVSV